MPLVDYSSDTDSSASGTDPLDAGPPPSKKRRTGPPPPSCPGPEPQPETGQVTAPPHSSALPPLPPSFHDLYASTVRTTTHDDPALHQGRTRQHPHILGNWPSHIYIEWHPPPAVHALLAGLIASLHTQAQAQTQTHARNTADITSFLLSDLATPQPLHISLSRPLVLASEHKDAFARDVGAAIVGSGVVACTLACSRVEWHRTEESGRSFLVLRVHSWRGVAGEVGREEEGEDGERGGVKDGSNNPELTSLLRRCNAVVAKYGQPPLYGWAESEDGSGRVGDAFHVSIAWSFAEPTEELKMLTERVFDEAAARKRIREVQVPVEGVKVKIGNVVTHVALRLAGRRGTDRVTNNLLGL